MNTDQSDVRQLAISLDDLMRYADECARYRFGVEQDLLGIGARGVQRAPGVAVPDRAGGYI